MKPIIRSLISGYVLIVLLSVYYTFVSTFLSAWQDPTKTVSISINTYGEGFIELISLIIGAVLLPIGGYYIMRDSIHAKYWRKQHANNKRTTEKL